MSISRASDLCALNLGYVSTEQWDKLYIMRIFPTSFFSNSTISSLDIKLSVTKYFVSL